MLQTDQISPFYKDQRLYLNAIQVIFFCGALFFMQQGISLSYKELPFPEMIKVALGPIASLPAAFKETHEEIRKEQVKKILETSRPGALSNYAAQIPTANEALLKYWLESSNIEKDFWVPNADGVSLSGGHTGTQAAVRLLRGNVEDYVRWNAKKNKAVSGKVERFEKATKPEQNVSFLNGVFGSPIKVKTGANLFKGYAYADVDTGFTNARFKLLESGEMTVSTEKELSSGVKFGIQQTISGGGNDKRTEAGFHFLW